MKEKDVIPQYMEEFSKTVPRAWWYKIPDNRYTGKKPFDVVGAYLDEKATPLAFEFKLHKTISPWPCSKVIDYQVKSLEDFYSVGGDARVVLAVRYMLSTAEKEKFNYPTRRVSLWVRWPILDFMKFKKDHTSLDIRALLSSGANGHIDGKLIEQ